jgi:subtilisin family serine protease
MTLYPGGRYAVVSGTSFAAPFVSGAASLLFQVDEFPGLAESFHALCSGTGLTFNLGCGGLDLLQAVRFFQMEIG